MGDALSIIRNLVTYRRNNRKTPDVLAQQQLAAFRKMVRHAMDHTEFYARHYQGLDPDQVVPRDLPIVTKQDLREHYHDFFTDSSLRREDLEAFVKEPSNFGTYYKGRYVVLHTSGTTGPSTILVYDREAFARIKAVSLVRGFDRPASPWTAAKVAVNPVKPKFAIVVIDGGLYPAVTNFMYQPAATRHFFQIERFSLFTPLDELVAALNEYQPWFLIGYPSVIAALALEQKAGRLHILDGPPRRSVATLSEPLLPQVRRLVKEVWGLPVIDTYGTGECLPLARGCSKHGCLHVNDDLAMMEVVDEDLEPVLAGVQGKSILVTNLFNHVQPFIRYQVSDLVTLAEAPCDCGSPLTTIQSVEGRTEEMIWLEDDGGNRELLHPYLFVVAMFRVPAVKDFQVIQTGPHRLQVRLEPIEPGMLDEEDVRRELRRELELAQLRSPLELDYKIVDHIGPDPSTGKVVRVKPLDITDLSHSK